MRKTYTTALILGLALALLITFSPVLAHLYWEGDDGKQIILPCARIIHSSRVFFVVHPVSNLPFYDYS